VDTEDTGAMVAVEDPEEADQDLGVEGLELRHHHTPKNRHSNNRRPLITDLVSGPVSRQEVLLRISPLIAGMRIETRGIPSSGRDTGDSDLTTMIGGWAPAIWAG